ncbi:hypothetical protein Strvi_9449 (plasmid) [Streptomyces violaceusniger Tu 4113]|uniref:Uncharacterized protein n=1 Tax=Streptomyces violaceusniger (strain Tu 4113) TaxID=653045 RepID=G2PGY8_STRV4|nr:hypothetical protein Strvi_9449 [Streptomyces violaceusniger Tu 4113]
MPLIALLPCPVAVAFPLSRTVAGASLLRRLIPDTARPPLSVRARPVRIATAGALPGAGWKSAHTSAAMPTAPWIQAPAICPASGPSNSHTTGVEATPTTANATTVILQLRDISILSDPTCTMDDGLSIA